jgi:RND family efflux transporter MFP subunit
MRTKITIVLLILLSVAVPVLALRAQATVQTIQAAQEMAGTEFTRVQTGTARAFIETLGEVEASASADLSFPVGGVVAEVYVEPGDYVTAGSVLAVLDNASEVIAYEQAVLSLNQAQANQYDLQRIDEDDVTLARVNLETAWASYANALNQLTPEDRAAMEADYQQALDAARALEEEASRAPGGYDSAAHDLLRAQAGEASFRAEITRLQNAQAQAQVESSGNSAYGRVLEAQAQLDQVLAGPSAEQIEQAALNVDLAAQQLANLQADYEDTFLVAPFDGYLSAVNIEVGAAVAPNVGVTQITDITPLLLTTRIDETDLAEVEAGMPIEVRFDALPDVTLTGTLGAIDPLGTTVDGIVTYDAAINLDAFPEGVRVGMSADVRLITDQAENVLVIPNSYIREDPDTGRITVNVVGSTGDLIPREVTLGLRGVQNSEVVSGLEAGEMIALRRISSERSFGGPPGGGRLFGGTGDDE